MIKLRKFWIFSKESAQNQEIRQNENKWIFTYFQLHCPDLHLIQPCLLTSPMLTLVHLRSSSQRPSSPASPQPIARRPDSGASTQPPSSSLFDLASSLYSIAAPPSDSPRSTLSLPTGPPTSFSFRFYVIVYLFLLIVCLQIIWAYLLLNNTSLLVASFLLK